MIKHSVEVENIRCGGCANTITRELSKHFSNVDVDIVSKTVTVEGKDEEAKNLLIEALNKLGYPLKGQDRGMAKDAVLKAKSFVSCAIGKIN